MYVSCYSTTASTWALATSTTRESNVKYEKVVFTLYQAGNFNDSVFVWAKITIRSPHKKTIFIAEIICSLFRIIPIMFYFVLKTKYPLNGLTVSAFVLNNQILFIFIIKNDVDRIEVSRKHVV